MSPGIPAAPPDVAIGLFGGSFDPPHAAHLMVSELALTRLRLDRVWWLVSPGNPLKRNAPGELSARIDAARRIVQDPRVTVTGLEAEIGYRYTADTISYLVRRFPRTRFVWLMGADNLRQFHRWHEWRGIAATVPFAVIDRPGSGFTAVASPAAKTLARYRIPESSAESLPYLAPPVWAFLHGPKMPISSTALRLAAGR